MSRALAAWITAVATSRTWDTPPAVPSTCADAMVWIESSTSRSGSTCSMWPRTVPRSVSAVSSSRGSSAWIRPARRRTCAADSSPVT